MLKLENTEVLGWEHAIRGMRNPLNSWGKSDSLFDIGYHGSKDVDTLKPYRTGYNIEGTEYAACADWTEDYALGSNDHDLMMRLAKGGPVHAKYRRMINVYVDITAPLYWWKEFDTYKVGTVANSCSTMHKIAAKEFTLEDFSCEHLMDNAMADAFQQKSPLDILYATIDMLNLCRRKYLGTKSKPMKNESARKELMKKYWWQMIQLLPSSYNQKRTVMLNYEVLANIYKSRRNHKLDEWHTFCDWIEDLPYSEIITGMSESEKMVRIGEKFHEWFKSGVENPDPEIIDKQNSFLERFHCVTFGTAVAGIFDTLEENVGPNDGLNKHFGGVEE